MIFHISYNAGIKLQKKRKHLFCQFSAQKVKFLTKNVKQYKLICYVRSRVFMIVIYYNVLRK